MFLFKNILLCLLNLTFITVKTQDDEIFSSLLDGGVNPIQDLKKNFYFVENKIPALAPKTEKVDIRLYYECLCPDCRNFDTLSFRTTVEKLAPYLNLHLYPYGNAKTIDHGNGEYEFICQHGPDECYGNKLHACAITYFGNMTKAALFNSCMMDSSRSGRGSDDKAADECGAEIENINASWIKQCAKSSQGNALLKYYGDESKKIGFKYVPYILINGVVNDGNNFMKDVCAAFTTPPPECAGI